VDKHVVRTNKTPYVGLYRKKERNMKSRVYFCFSLPRKK